MQTFLIVIWFYILGISLGSKSDAIENAWIAYKRWVNAASLVVQKEATLESSFLPLPAHGIYGTGPSGPHPR